MLLLEQLPFLPSVCEGDLVDGELALLATHHHVEVEALHRAPELVARVHWQFDGLPLGAFFRHGHFHLDLVLNFVLHDETERDGLLAENPEGDVLGLADVEAVPVLTRPAEQPAPAAARLVELDGDHLFAGLAVGLHRFQDVRENASLFVLPGAVNALIVGLEVLEHHFCGGPQGGNSGRFLVFYAGFGGFRHGGGVQNGAFSLGNPNHHDRRRGQGRLKRVAHGQGLAFARQGRRVGADDAVDADVSTLQNRFVFALQRLADGFHQPRLAFGAGSEPGDLDVHFRRGQWVVVHQHHVEVAVFILRGPRTQFVAFAVQRRVIGVGTLHQVAPEKAGQERENVIRGAGRTLGVVIREVGVGAASEQTEVATRLLREPVLKRPDVGASITHLADGQQILGREHGVHELVELVFHRGAKLRHENGNLAHGLRIEVVRDLVVELLVGFFGETHGQVEYADVLKGVGRVKLFVPIGGVGSLAARHREPNRVGVNDPEVGRDACLLEGLEDVDRPVRVVVLNLATGFDRGVHGLHGLGELNILFSVLVALVLKVLVADFPILAVEGLGRDVHVLHPLDGLFDGLFAGVLFVFPSAGGGLGPVRPNAVGVDDDLKLGAGLLGEIDAVIHVDGQPSRFTGRVVFPIGELGVTAAREPRELGPHGRGSRVENEVLSVAGSVINVDVL